MGGGASTSFTLSQSARQHIAALPEITRAELGQQVNLAEQEIERLKQEIVKLQEATAESDSATGQLEADGKQQVQKTATSISREDSELLGVSLEWVLSEFQDTAWEILEQKKHLMGEPEWKSELSNIKMESDSSNFVKMNDLNKNNISDLNFICLKTAVANGPSAIGDGTLCPRDNEPNSSFVDALYATGKSGRATIFMSWVWVYTVAQVLSGLESWHVTNHDQQRGHHFIWWCFMCNNQHRLHWTIEDSATLSRIFGERLVTIGKMLIMLDTIENPLYVTRCWCLFEVWKVVEKHMANEVTVALSGDGMTSLRRNIKSNQFVLENCLSIDSEKLKLPRILIEDSSWSR